MGLWRRLRQRAITTFRGSQSPEGNDGTPGSTSMPPERIVPSRQIQKPPQPQKPRQPQPQQKAKQQAKTPIKSKKPKQVSANKEKRKPMNNDNNNKKKKNNNNKNNNNRTKEATSKSPLSHHRQKTSDKNVALHEDIRDIVGAPPRDTGAGAAGSSEGDEYVSLEGRLPPDDNFWKEGGAFGRFSNIHAEGDIRETITRERIFQGKDLPESTGSTVGPTQAWSLKEEEEEEEEEGAAGINSIHQKPSVKYNGEDSEESSSDDSSSSSSSSSDESNVEVLRVGKRKRTWRQRTSRASPPRASPPRASPPRASPPKESTPSSEDSSSDDSSTSTSSEESDEGEEIKPPEWVPTSGFARVDFTGQISNEIRIGGQKKNRQWLLANISDISSDSSSSSYDSAYSSSSSYDDDDEESSTQIEPESTNETEPMVQIPNHGAEEQHEVEQDQQGLVWKEPDSSSSSYDSAFSSSSDEESSPRIEPEKTDETEPMVQIPNRGAEKKPKVAQDHQGLVWKEWNEQSQGKVESYDVDDQDWGLKLEQESSVLELTMKSLEQRWENPSRRVNPWQDFSSSQDRNFMQSLIGGRNPFAPRIVKDAKDLESESSALEEQRGKQESGFDNEQNQEKNESVIVQESNKDSMFEEAIMLLVT